MWGGVYSSEQYVPPLAGPDMRKIQVLAVFWYMLGHHPHFRWQNAQSLTGGIKLTPAQGCRTGPPGYKRLAGRSIRQPYAGVDYTPPSGTMNLATGSRE
jgi:hypothetical protein